MKKLLVLFALLVSSSTMTLAGGLRPTGDDQGHDSKHDKGCTLANVAGAYGVYGSGTFLPGNQVGVPPGAYATIGRAELDGHGVFTVTSQTASFNGAIVKHITGQGTYTVNDDCTGSLLIGTDAADIVFVDDANEFYATDTTSGLVTTFVFKRINRDK